MSRLGVLCNEHFHRKVIKMFKVQTKIFSSTTTSNKTKNVHAALSVKDGIGVIKLISPGKVNVLNAEVLEEVEEIIEKFENDPNIRGGVIISNKADCFIAGADINMLSACKTNEQLEIMSRQGQDILNRLAQSNKPVVAAIMGSCLGGGLEVALACHYRIAVDQKTTIGLPEVMLGLLPGCGGTQRLPKLIGIPNTLDLILTGKNIRADKAKSLGLVDHIIRPLGPGLITPKERTFEYLEEMAITTAQQLANGVIKVNRAPKKLIDKLSTKIFQFKYVKDYIFEQAKAKVLQQTNGLYPAPLRILKVVRAGLDKGEKIGFMEEAKAFGELAMTDESKGLISLYTGRTECKRNKFGNPRKQVNKVGVIGAGLMGAGISQVSIEKGFKTILKDINVENLASGEVQIEKGINGAVKRKKMTLTDSEKCLSNLIATLDYNYFSKVNIVIEAAFESIDLKNKILKEVEEIIPENCVFATNTSVLPISKIAEGCKRPDKVIGMHYFSPVDKMPLLEIVMAEATSQETLRVAFDLALKQGKVPIVVKDGPGFYTSRIICMYGFEIFRLLLEGVDPHRLNKTGLDLGFPIGCVTLADEVGLDVGYHVYRSLIDAFGEKATRVSPEFAEDFMKEGFLGRKVGKGIFLYNTGSEEKVVNEAAMEIIKKHYQEPKVPLTDENIQLRVLTSFINESILCLQEGIISSPLDGDIGAVFGMGFPPFTGGPFHYVDTFGAKKLVNKMKEFEEKYGSSFKPCQLFIDHCKSGVKFFP